MNNKSAEAVSGGKKKHHPIRTFFIVLISLVILLLFVVAAWFVYASCDRKKSLSVIPAEFAAYVRTDHLWKSANPLVDVKAIDVFLSDAKYGQIRNAVMQFRSSPIRKNKLVAIAADRRIDAAFYSDTSFAAAIDMGGFSAITRLAPLFAKQIKVQGLSYVTSDANEWFQYESGKTIIYAKPYHNLLLVSTSKKRFDKMCLAKCIDDYSAERLAELSEKLHSPFRIGCDVNTLLAYDETIQHKTAPYILPLLKKDALAFVDFGITDNDVHVQILFPLAKLLKNSIPALSADTKISEQFLELVVNSSSESKLLNQLPDCVQYYTLLNAGDLPHLLKAAQPFIPGSKNIDNLWSKGEVLCKMVFSLTLEDLLYSWTGKEIAVLGLEGKKDPVFAVQITDEQKRAAVFQKIASSFVIDESKKLILNGISVPQLELPDFLQGLLGAAGVTVAKPYYLVSGGYVFFSESAENVVEVTSAERARLLEHTDMFKQVSSLQQNETAISLYYNLARSIPFFLKSSSSLSKTLQLYNIGRADVCVDRKSDGSGTLSVLLQAVSRQEKQTTAVPGFPLTLDGKKNTQLCRTNAKRPQLLFWVQDGSIIHLYNADTSAHATYDASDAVFIVPSRDDKLWALTSAGSVFLFDKELKVVEGFPVALEVSCPVAPALYGDELLVFADDGSFRMVRVDGSVEPVQIGTNVKLHGTPTVCDSTIAFYSKRLAGSLFIAQKTASDEGQTAGAFESHEIPVTGIAYGEPAVMKNKSKAENGTVLSVAFVTQNGIFSLFDELGEPILSAPIALDKVYYANTVSNDNYFFVVSSDYTLTRIGTDGSTNSVAVAEVTAQAPYIVAYDYDNDGNKEIFVNGDSNLIYGYTQDFTALKNFPVVGTGLPQFVDLDGDNKNECVTISLDGKLNAYKVLKR